MTRPSAPKWTAALGPMRIATASGAPGADSRRAVCCRGLEASAISEHSKECKLARPGHANCGDDQLDRANLFSSCLPVDPHQRRDERSQRDDVARQRRQVARRT